ncbi:hypothetical protein R1flu_005557 [Riccia fluitans]|uniref:Uncharacterized protein n=1 Tax=Riccia fluitans TaxID=41844 RepID=A0ABD1YTR0_9MARC
MSPTGQEDTRANSNSGIFAIRANASRDNKRQTRSDEEGAGTMPNVQARERRKPEPGCAGQLRTKDNLLDTRKGYQMQNDKLNKVPQVVEAAADTTKHEQRTRMPTNPRIIGG